MRLKFNMRYKVNHMKTKVENLEVTKIFAKHNI